MADGLAHIKWSTKASEDRIVNISQSHVRPIHRKLRADVAGFGAVIAIRLVKRLCLVEILSWMSFNEGKL